MRKRSLKAENVLLKEDNKRLQRLQTHTKEWLSSVLLTLTKLEQKNSRLQELARDFASVERDWLNAFPAAAESRTGPVMKLVVEGLGRRLRALTNEE